MTNAIGDYLYEKNAIGFGTFSRVYKAKNIKTGLEVALKRIDSGGLTDSLRARLDKEIYICKNLDHPNIVKLYEVIEDTENDYLYLVLEYCSGGDLKEFSKERSFKESYVKYYAIQLKDGLEYLRSKNILHRDLKPQNILLTNNFKVLKLADFGFARETRNDSMIETVLGSPLYMAPELIKRQTYTVKADLWSVGLIIYELIYGSHPFKGATSLFDLISRIENSKIVFHDSKQVSENAINLLQNLLKIDYHRRLDWEGFFNHMWFYTDIPSVDIGTSPTDHEFDNDIFIDETMDPYNLDSEDYSKYEFSSYTENSDIVNCQSGNSISNPIQIPRKLTTHFSLLGNVVRNYNPRKRHDADPDIDDSIVRITEEEYPPTRSNVGSPLGRTNSDNKSMGESIIEYMNTSIGLFKDSMRFINSL